MATVYRQFVIVTDEAKWELGYVRVARMINEGKKEFRLVKIFFFYIIYCFVLLSVRFVNKITKITISYYSPGNCNLIKRDIFFLLQKSK